eukprot:COSAG02_NODE_10401_length_1949_cov_2.821622_2_plen_145_part_00
MDWHAVRSQRPHSLPLRQLLESGQRGTNSMSEMCVHNRYAVQLKETLLWTHPVTKTTWIGRAIPREWLKPGENRTSDHQLFRILKAADPRFVSGSENLNQSSHHVCGRQAHQVEQCDDCIRAAFIHYRGRRHNSRTLSHKRNSV